MKRQSKLQQDYHKLFDIGNKGYLTNEEEEIYRIFKKEYKFHTEDILDLEINENNLNNLVNKFNLKLTRKDIKSIVDYIYF